MGQVTKTEKQEKKEENKQKEEEQQKMDDAPMDTDDMPLLISNTDSDDSSKGTKRKHIFNQKPTKPPIKKRWCMILCNQ